MPLSPKQVQAIDVLLTAKSLHRAAKRIGVDPGTLRRWLRDKEFNAHLLSAQRQAIAQNVRGVASLANLAIQTLANLMRKSPDDEVKLKAAQEAIERLFDADLKLQADESSDPPSLPEEDGGPAVPH